MPDPRPLPDDIDDGSDVDTRIPPCRGHDDAAISGAGGAVDSVGVVIGDLSKLGDNMKIPPLHKFDPPAHPRISDEEAWLRLHCAVVSVPSPVVDPGFTDVLFQQFRSRFPL